MRSSKCVALILVIVMALFGGQFLSKSHLPTYFWFTYIHACLVCWFQEHFGLLKV